MYINHQSNEAMAKINATSSRSRSPKAFRNHHDIMGKKWKESHKNLMISPEPSDPSAVASASQLFMSSCWIVRFSLILEDNLRCLFQSAFLSDCNSAAIELAQVSRIFKETSHIVPTTQPEAVAVQHPSRVFLRARHHKHSQAVEMPYKPIA